LCLVADRAHVDCPSSDWLLRPTLLGWDSGSWLGGGSPKPWTFHLGAKLVLPLHYLAACGYSNDTLVVFTDHDVLFQGGAAALREAYRAAAAASGSHLLFSTEHQPYPEEVGPLFPPAPGPAPFRYLNSGMWAGPVGAVLELLQTLVGVRRGESLPALLDVYLNWERHTARASPTPRVYVDNDQTAYARLFVCRSSSRDDPRSPEITRE